MFNQEVRKLPGRVRVKQIACDCGYSVINIRFFGERYLRRISVKTYSRRAGISLGFSADLSNCPSPEVPPIEFKATYITKPCKSFRCRIYIYVYYVCRALTLLCWRSRERTKKERKEARREAHRVCINIARDDELCLLTFFFIHLFISRDTFHGPVLYLYTYRDLSYHFGLYCKPCRSYLPHPFLFLSLFFSSSLFRSQLNSRRERCREDTRSISGKRNLLNLTACPEFRGQMENSHASLRSSEWKERGTKNK